MNLDLLLHTELDKLRLSQKDELTVLQGIMLSFFVRSTLILSFSIAGLLGCFNESLDSGIQQPGQAVNVSQCVTTEEEFCIELPFLAEIQLNEGGSITGQFKEIDLQARKITVELAGDSQQVSIAEIKKIDFRGESLPEGSSSVIRDSEIWSIKPLEEFQANPSTGYLKIKREAVSREQERNDFISSQANGYLIQSLWFSSDLSEIVLKVTPK